MDAIDELLADLESVQPKSVKKLPAYTEPKPPASPQQPKAPAPQPVKQQATIQQKPSQALQQPTKQIAPQLPPPTNPNAQPPVPPKQKDLESAKKYAQEIESYCRASGKKFEDPEFLANAFSLYPEAEGPLIGKIYWKRPNEIAPNPQLFVDGVQSGDVIQGKNLIPHSKYNFESE